MPVSIEQFVSQLSESGLLSKDEIAAFQETLDAPSETAEELAKELVKRKKLTKFQAQMIYQGKGNGLLLGEYVILDRIGAGGMGQVYLAEHRRMKRRVALKTLPKEVTKDKATVLRFHREVQAAAKLSHSNIVTAHDAGETNGIHYLVMERVEGDDLHKLVKENGRLPVDHAVDCIVQGAKGLEYAHSEGIVHRDIKPANMLLDKKGTVKILDMGLARIDGNADEDPATALTQRGAVMGTVDYMAPEQAQDTHSADARSDIYSLGCILHYLLTAESVYKGDTLVNRIIAHRDTPIPSLRSSRPDAPEHLDAVFQKMVAKQPEDRYQTMNEVVSALQTCAVAEPSPTTAITDAPDSAFLQFLNAQDVAATPTECSPGGRKPVATQNTPPTQAVSERQTLPSGFLDETISGGLPSSRKRSRKFSLGWTLGIAGGVLAAVLMLSAIFFKVETPEGIIIIEIDQPELAGAVVSVDGEKKITIKARAIKEPVVVEADEKTHTLKITKGGFETYTKDFTMKAGGKQSIRVWLERVKVAGKEDHRKAVGTPPAVTPTVAPAGRN